MNVDVNFKWQPGAKNKIEQTPKKMLYDIARITLDTTYQNIPLYTLILLHFLNLV